MVADGAWTRRAGSRHRSGGSFKERSEGVEIRWGRPLEGGRGQDCEGVRLHGQDLGAEPRHEDHDLRLEY